MSDGLNIVLVQYDIVWHNIGENFSIVEKLLSDLGGKPDLILLPEAFCCGFTNQPEQLGNINEKVSSWMLELANNYQAVVMGSFPYNSMAKYFNRLLCVYPGGGMDFYDKHHLFSLTGEEKIYTAGRVQKNFPVAGWKISPRVCYDIRFPVWCRNTEFYDILAVVANWPESRNMAWESLLRARAIENQCYVLGVNRIGRDDYGTTYAGNSLVFAPDGNVLASLAGNKAGIIQYKLSRKSLSDFRKKFPFLEDRDNFKLVQ